MLFLSGVIFLYRNKKISCNKWVFLDSFLNGSCQLVLAKFLCPALKALRPKWRWHKMQSFALTVNDPQGRIDFWEKSLLTLVFLLKISYFAIVLTWLGFWPRKVMQSSDDYRFSNFLLKQLKAKVVLLLAPLLDLRFIICSWFLLATENCCQLGVHWIVFWALMAPGWLVGF